jgi:uncharacterized protein YrrD
MLKMELKEGTSVFTSGGKEVGKVNRFILDPATNEVTHIVVQKGWLFSEDKVVPFNMVDSATDDKVVLNENMESFDELPAFEEAHYVRAREADVSRGGNPRYRTGERGQPSPLDESDRDETVEADVSRGGGPRTSYPAYYWYPPHGYIGYPVGFYGWPPMETIRNIPGDTIPIREGTDVMSADGEHVGDIERLFVESDSNKATHFVISQGLFKDRKLVPAHWVRTVEEDKVQLVVSSGLLEDLPAYQAE